MSLSSKKRTTKSSSTRVIDFVSILTFTLSIIGFIVIAYKSDFDISWGKLSTGVFGSVAGLLLAYLFSIIFKKKTVTVFLAHTDSDKADAVKIQAFLKSKRIKIIDEDSVSTYGHDIKLSLSKAIATSDYVLVILSRSSKKDKMLNTIIDLSKSSSKKIIPIILDDQNSVPDKISSYKTVSTTGGLEKASQELAKFLVPA